jgi:hypothetical protein
VLCKTAASSYKLPKEEVRTHVRAPNQEEAQVSVSYEALTILALSNSPSIFALHTILSLTK